MNGSLKHDLLHPEDLTRVEIAEMSSGPHATAEQLNLLAAHAHHVNILRREEIEELSARLARVEALIKGIEARRGTPPAT